MKIKSFEFNLRELAGSMGDFGTLFPLAIGYIIICGFNPAGFLVMMGLANIVTGLVYRLPGLMSESVLLWDKLRIHIYRIKHGKLRIVYSNSDI